MSEISGELCKGKGFVLKKKSRDAYLNMLHCIFRRSLMI